MGVDGACERAVFVGAAETPLRVFVAEGGGLLVEGESVGFVAEDDIGALGAFV